MSSPIRRRLLVGTLAVVCGGLSYLFQGMKSQGAQTEYLRPRYPAYLQRKPNELEKRRLAYKVVRQVGGWTTLGLSKPGDKIVIVVRKSQDMDLLKTLVEGLKEREIEADYVFEVPMVAESLGMPEAQVQKILGGGNLFGIGQGVKDGWREAFRWPLFFPEELREKLAKEFRLNVEALDMTVGGGVLLLGMKKYLELHPEYDGLYGGGGRQVDYEVTVGPKWRSLWEYDNWSSVYKKTVTFPNDVWRMMEDKVMGFLPWVEDVRVTDPEGTDLRFKVSPRDAEMWAKAAYLPNHIYLWPFQGTRDLYLREGIKGHIIPDANGVLAATLTHSGVYPRLKVHIKHGVIERLEGGGRYGQLWNTLLENPELRNTHYPYMPYPGIFYLFEASVGIHPKFTRDYRSMPPDTGRSGLFHWGFGIESTLPEIMKFAEQRGLPNDHGFHMQTYFTTYEIKPRGSDKWVKIVDKGHLVALDDAEVRALASRYGDAEQVLREGWVPAIPGINVPGEYVKDYGSNPLPYLKREGEEIEKGTYRYLE